MLRTSRVPYIDPESHFRSSQHSAGSTEQLKAGRDFIAVLVMIGNRSFTDGTQHTLDLMVRNAPAAFTKVAVQNVFSQELESSRQGVVITELIVP